MSLEQDGKNIHCNGAGCKVRAFVPVARGGDAESAGRLQSARGWLFVLNDSAARHYCPRCSAHQRLLLLYFAVFSVVSARERRAFWATVPSKALLAALAADALIGTILTRVGLPGLPPLPWLQMLALFACAMVACLGVNDAVKVAMIKWRVPTAAA